MKKNVIVVGMTALFILVTGFAALAADIGPFDKAKAAEDGRQIVDIAKDFNKPKQDLMIFARMTLKSGDTVSDTRKVILKQKTYGDLSRALFRFIDSMKRGITFLTIETHGPNNDQYLFTPGIGRPRQIATQDRQNNFEDTDFTNEDLGGIKLDDYTYRRSKDESVSGRTCYKVYSTAKATDARFPKRISWIDQETFLPLKVKVYNQDNKLEIIMAAGDIKKIGDIFVPFKTVAKNLQQDHTTILDVVRAQVDIGIDGRLFNKEEMGESWKESF